MELQPDGQQQHDSQRALLAMMLILGLMLLWGYFAGPRPTTEQPPEDKPSTAAAPATAKEPSPATDTTPVIGPSTAAVPTTAAPPTTAKAPTTAIGPEQPKPEPPPVEEPPPQTVTKQSALLAAEFTNQDGALARLVLIDYRRTPLDKRKALRARKQDPNADLTPYGFPLLGQAGLEPSLVVRDIEDATAKQPAWFPPRRFEVVADEERKVAFRSTFHEEQLELTKTFILPGPEGNQRHIDVAIRLRNVGEAPVKLPGYRLRGPGGIAVDQGPPSWDEPEPTERERKDASRYMSGAVAFETDRGEVSALSRSVRKLASTRLERGEGRVVWVAAESNYFAVILEPRRTDDEDNWVYAGGAQHLGEHNVEAYVQTTKLTLQPDQAVTHHYRLYAGPKDADDLRAYDAGYDELIHRGLLYPLKWLMAAILHFAYWCVPNYGVAIIFLTLIVRACLHPLSKKSQTSMQKMQKLAPQMQEIKEKYKNDKRRQQEELMKLHREYGVNPLGGCLPMLLQLPVFIGLYQTLRGSIELRHAPFVLWVQDLSQPDSFMGAVNILPLVCVAIMFIQQRMMPKSPDPQQQQTQKIMGYVMPVFLGYIFYGLPSGLALYFIASMGVGIIEQKLIRRHLDKMGDLKPVERKASKKSARRKPAKPARKRKAF